MAWTFYDRYGRARAALTTTHPPGSIVAFGGNAAPAGWLLCDGAEVPKITYPDLFAVIGTNYNTNGTTPIGDAVNNFRLPDFRGHSPIGAGTAVAGSPGAGATYTHGTKDGERLHALTVGEVPRHTHGPGTLATNSVGTGITIDGNTANITGVTGGNHTHTPAAGNSFLQTSPAGDPWQGTDRPDIVYGTPGAGQANFALNAYTINRASFTPHSSLQTAGEGGHSHSITQSNHTHTVTDPQHSHSVNSGSTEDGTAAGLGAGSPTHNNVGPVLPTNFIIKF